MSDNFYEQSVDVISGNKPLNKSTADIESEFRSLEFREAENAMTYRSKLFKWGIGAASACLVCSILWMACSIFVRVDTRLGVAFIASLAVEVVGIIAIIAKYLFPENGMPRSRNPVKSVSESDL